MKNKWTELKPHIKEVWKLSLPAILTRISTIVMQYIDTAMVGALGAGASAAIGLVSSSTWLFEGPIYAVSAGFSVQVAHSIGAEDESRARKVLRHGLVSALVVSGFICLLGIACSGKLPIWLRGDVSIQRDATLYFFVFSLTLPFTQLSNLCASSLQCCGDMVSPSIINTLMCVMDVGFNAIFIPEYGVLGAGIGTALARVVSTLALLWRCCISNPKISLSKHKEKGSFDKDIIGQALRIGLPVGAQEIALCLAMVVSTGIIAPLGTIAIAANSFAITAESLCYLPGYGIEAAAVAIVGRNIGAGDSKLARRYGNICTAFGAAFMGITGLLMFIFCPYVFKFLTPDPTVRLLAARVLRVELISEPLFGVSIVAAGALQGTGDTLVPSLLNLGSIWIVRLGLALILVKRMGLMGMWIAMSVELCIRGLLMLYRLKSTRYFDNPVN